MLALLAGTLGLIWALPGVIPGSGGSPEHFWVWSLKTYCEACTKGTQRLLKGQGHRTFHAKALDDSSHLVLPPDASEPSPVGHRALPNFTFRAPLSIESLGAVDWVAGPLNSHLRMPALHPPHIKVWRIPLSICDGLTCTVTVCAAGSAPLKEELRSP